MWDREDLSAAGYLAGWKVVRRLPEPIARTLFAGVRTTQVATVGEWRACAVT